MSRLILAFALVSIPLCAVADSVDQVAFTSYRDGNWEIYRMGWDGSNPYNLSRNTSSDWSPAWSPDGMKIAFQSNRTGNWDIWVMNADGSNPVNLTNHGSRDERPCWSPDSKRIAWETDRDGNLEVYAMNFDGTYPTNLSRNGAADARPAWSPDGYKIAFQSDRGGNWDVWAMGADGASPVNLTFHAAVDWSPAWSPDGAKLAFTSNRDGGDWEICTMLSNGVDQRNLTNNVSDDLYASWSSTWDTESDQIVFETTRTGNAEIHTMWSNGTYPANLTRHGAADHYPSWSPSGTPPKTVVVVESARAQKGSIGSVKVRIENVTGLAGYQFDLRFDWLRLLTVSVRIRLPGDVFSTAAGNGWSYGDSGTAHNALDDSLLGTVSSVRLTTIGGASFSGNGSLASVSFVASAVFLGSAPVEVTNLILTDANGRRLRSRVLAGAVDVVDGTPYPYDVNLDGIVDILDLTIVAQGTNPRADVNADGLVNTSDLVAVALHFGERTAIVAGAPRLPQLGDSGMLERHLAELRRADDGSDLYRKAIANLERFAAMAVPTTTSLLANFPNPFNPETWLPFQLAESSDVTIRVFDGQGALVREFRLGTLPAGRYDTRNKALYWDGTTAIGERAASGVYWYTIDAGRYRDTHRMVLAE